MRSDLSNSCRVDISKSISSIYRFDKSFLAVETAVLSTREPQRERDGEMKGWGGSLRRRCVIYSAERCRQCRRFCGKTKTTRSENGAPPRRLAPTPDSRPPPSPAALTVRDTGASIKYFVIKTCLRRLSLRRCIRRVSHRHPRRRTTGTVPVLAPSRYYGNKATSS